MSVDARVRAPSAGQYERLLLVAAGTVGLTWTEGQARSLLEHGWVTFGCWCRGSWGWPACPGAGAAMTEAEKVREALRDFRTLLEAGVGKLGPARVTEAEAALDSLLAELASLKEMCDAAETILFLPYSPNADERLRDALAASRVSLGETP